MESLRTAVIGVGGMGQHHARILSQLRGAELVGIADTDSAKASEEAKSFGTRPYADFKQLLEKERPDAVSIAVPTSFHSKIGCEVLGHCAALVEKPIANDLQGAAALVKASKRSGNCLMVGHIERFNPAITQLKRHILESNESILALAAMRLGISPPKNVSTGVVIDLAIHDIDLVRFLTGEEIESVSAKTKNFGITPFEDCAHIFLKTKSSSASIVANWITPRKIRQLYVSLRSSFVYLNYLTQELQVFEPDNRTKQIAFEKAEPLKLELEAFLESVRNGTEPPVSGLDGTEALKAALLALQRVE